MRKWWHGWICGLAGWGFVYLAAWVNIDVYRIGRINIFDWTWWMAVLCFMVGICFFQALFNKQGR